MLPLDKTKVAAYRRKLKKARYAQQLDPVMHSRWLKANSSKKARRLRSTSMAAKYKNDPQWACKRTAAYIKARRTKSSRTKSSVATTNQWANQLIRNKMVSASAASANKGFSSYSYASSKSIREGRFTLRSKDELVFCWMLDCSKDVLGFYYEPGIIPYELHGKIRTYIPDFLVVFIDHSVVLVELKPKGKCNGTKEWDEMYKAKRLAAMKVCYKVGMSWKHLSKPTQFWKKGRVSIRLN